MSVTRCPESICNQRGASEQSASRLFHDSSMNIYVSAMSANRTYNVRATMWRDEATMHRVTRVVQNTTEQVVGESL